jgi:putative membrane protein insertion efficiency factor
MVSAGGGQFDNPAQQRRRRRDDGSEPWWSNCVPDDCGGCWPDWLPDCDCVPCDLNLMFLGAIALSAPRRPARTRPTAPARAGMFAIRGYQRWLSHRLPTHCRHTPTCSAYGMTAVRRYGLTTGSRLIAARLQRCKAPTPFGTYDPVP